MGDHVVASRPTLLNNTPAQLVRGDVRHYCGLLTFQLVPGTPRVNKKPFCGGKHLRHLTTFMLPFKNFRSSLLNISNYLLESLDYLSVKPYYQVGVNLIH